MTEAHPESASQIEREDKWQKHVMIALWVTVTVVIVLAAALVYADYHGWFQSSTGQSTSPPPWPTGS